MRSCVHLSFVAEIHTYTSRTFCLLLSKKSPYGPFRVSLKALPKHHAQRMLSQPGDGWVRPFAFIWTWTGLPTDTLPEAQTDPQHQAPCSGRWRPSPERELAKPGV